MSIERIKMAPGKYSIRREGDGVGDSGERLEALQHTEEGTVVVAEGEIRVGCCVLCGTAFSRSFAPDWWCTTEVTEIFDVTETTGREAISAKFRTANSVYHVEVF